LKENATALRCVDLRVKRNSYFINVKRISKEINIASIKDFYVGRKINSFCAFYRFLYSLVLKYKDEFAELAIQTNIPRHLKGLWRAIKTIIKKSINKQKYKGL